MRGRSLRRKVLGPSGRVQWSRWYSRQLYPAPPGGPRYRYERHRNSDSISQARSHAAALLALIGVKFSIWKHVHCRSYHQFLVCVKVNIDMKSNFLVWDANSGRGKCSIVRAGILRFKTQVLKIVDTLSIGQLDGLEVVHRGPPVVVAEPALQGHVVVLHAPTNEVIL